MISSKIMEIFEVKCSYSAVIEIVIESWDSFFQQKQTSELGACDGIYKYIVVDKMSMCYFLKTCKHKKY